jgi:hypothetical protein
MRFPSRTVAALAGSAAALFWACSGASPRTSNPSAVSGVSGSGSVRVLDASPSPALPSPSPTLTPCPYGKGTVDTTCVRGVPVFLEKVDAAIDQLVQQRPEIFELGDAAGPGGYRVLDADQYQAGVVKNLEAMAFCAAAENSQIELKNSNEFSEHYDILLSTQHIRRGEGSYRATCNPPAFPVDAADLIDGIRVAFFGFRCPEGVEVPRNGAGQLPVGCEGYVTATPKTKDNKDVDPRVHGPDIQWIHWEGHEQVLVEDFPGVPFNKTLVGLEPGGFRLCAVVKGVEGCLNGTVIP